MGPPSAGQTSPLPHQPGSGLLKRRGPETACGHRNGAALPPTPIPADFRSMGDLALRGLESWGSGIPPLLRCHPVISIADPRSYFAFGQEGESSGSPPNLHHHSPTHCCFQSFFVFVSICPKTTQLDSLSFLHLLSYLCLSVYLCVCVCARTPQLMYATVPKLLLNNLHKTHMVNGLLLAALLGEK